MFFEPKLWTRLRDVDNFGPTKQKVFILSAQLQSISTLLNAAKDSVKADLTVKLWDGSTIDYNRTDAANIEVVINSADTIRQMLLKPNIATLFGLYGSGDISITDASPLQLLKATDHVSILNFFKSYSKAKLAKALAPFVFKERAKFSPRAFLDRFQKGKRDDKAMIAFHYDVSNDFYKLFLDSGMVYSCAYFKDWDNDIDQAQIDKLDHICRKLRLKPGEQMLDVGCGWGSLACHAAEFYGVTVKGVTLSETQFALVNERIKQRGLEDKVTVELTDFRDLKERNHFDKISMIEMFEHIGADNYDSYYKNIHRMLKPGGLCLHQASTRRVTPNLADFDHPTGYQKTITKYIFPGGELDHIGRTITDFERHGFEVHDTESLREHFRLTLELWHDKLWENRAEAEELVGDELVRLWLAYFALFEVGFQRNVVNLYQTLSSKRRIGVTGPPATREDIYA